MKEWNDFFFCKYGLVCVVCMKEWNEENFLEIYAPSLQKVNLSIKKKKKKKKKKQLMCARKSLNIGGYS